ncbi:MAG TPA: response regulator [Burkholderiales bacterium]
MGLRVLVVDDDRDLATGTEMILRAMGHDVRVAHDGAEALEIAAAFQPEAALVDLGMPNMNGYLLARKLREWRWTRDAVLIAVTGWGGERERERAKEAGFDHHLLKPAQPERIAELLAEVRPAASAARGDNP